MISNRANPPLPCPRVFPILIGLGIFLFIITIITNTKDSTCLGRVSSRLKYPNSSSGSFKQLSDYDLKEYSVKTHKGYVTLNELNEKVYKLLGYEIEKPTLPVPTLRMVNEPTCDIIFSEWYRVSQEPQPVDPPNRIPSGDMDAFLLFGYSALGSWYMNDKNSAKGEKPKLWDKVSELMEYPKDKLADLAYHVESASIFHAMDSYRLDNMSGVVIGSMKPWVEVMALRHGAKKILTVEYNKLNIEEKFRDRMSSIFPVDFVKNYTDYVEKFDFAVSFSSIEHSGLARYGDPIDPIGDLREMLKIRCILKKGGLLFLGFPLGTDALQYNAHRIYGPIRLAMMFYGFEWLGTFSGTDEKPFELNSKRLHSKGKFGMIQHTMVLRKL